MKYYIIAGELSGDLHASYLMKEIKRKDESAEFRFWGGDRMVAESHESNLVKHIKELAIMGFIEVVINLKTVLRNLALCKKDLLEWKPDALILVDYPGFNLRIAKFAKKNNIKNYYYISPQVWAWKKGRIKTIKKILEKLYVILPFEKEFYAKHSMEVEYKGNPLLDEINDYSINTDKSTFLQNNDLDEKPIIALLPGSRTQEIKKMLPIQLSLVDKYPEFNFVVAGVSTHSEEFYKTMIGNKNNVKLIYNQTYSIINNAHCAVVTSGTATLETALFGIPEVVCYKANPITFIIAKYLAKIEYISLVNIILKQKAVTELLQEQWNEECLEKEFKQICFDDAYREEMKYLFNKLKSILGDSGASSAIAQSIIEDLNTKK